MKLLHNSNVHYSFLQVFKEHPSSCLGVPLNIYVIVGILRIYKLFNEHIGLPLCVHLSSLSQLLNKKGRRCTVKMDYLGTHYKGVYHTSLDFLDNTDKPFINYNTRINHSRMKYMMKLFTGKYNEGIKLSYWQDGCLMESPFQVVKLGYYKVLVDKIDSLFWSNDVLVKCGDPAKDKEITKIIERTKFFHTIREGIRLCEIYGNCFVRVSKIGLSCVPMNCVPILNPHDVREISAYFLYEYLRDKDGKVDSIRLEIHTPGEIFEQVREYSGNSLFAQVLGRAKSYNYRGRNIPASGITYQTGCNLSLVNNFVMNAEADPVWGSSCLEDIKDVVTLNEILLTTSGRVIQSNSRPLLTCDISQTTVSEKSGERRLKLAQDESGKQYMITTPGNKPEYLEIQGSLDKSADLREELMEHMYALSQLGKIYWTSDVKGQVSTDTINSLISSAVDKVNKDLNSIWYTIRELLWALLTLNGIDVDIEDLSITFSIGKSLSQKETAQVIKTLDDAGILSKKSMLQKFFGMDEEAAQAELDAVKQEKEAANPIIQTQPNNTHVNNYEGDKIGGQKT